MLNLVACTEIGGGSLGEGGAKCHKEPTIKLKKQEIF